MLYLLYLYQPIVHYVRFFCHPDEGSIYKLYSK